MGSVGYIKNPISFWLLMIFAIITCGVMSFYHWELIVMGMYIGKLTYTTMAYIALLYIAFPIALWIVGKRVGKQVTKRIRIKNRVMEGKSTFKNAFLTAWGIKPKTTKAAVKQYKPRTVHYYRAPMIMLLITIVIAMIGMQYSILYRCMNFPSYKKFLGVFLWDISLSGGNAAIIVVLSFLAYKMKSRLIPKNYLPK
jgi:hypothetical protein